MDSWTVFNTAAVLLAQMGCAKRIPREKNLNLIQASSLEKSLPPSRILSFCSREMSRRVGWQQEAEYAIVSDNSLCTAAVPQPKHHKENRSSEQAWLFIISILFYRQPTTSIVSFNPKFWVGDPLPRLKATVSILSLETTALSGFVTHN